MLTFENEHSLGTKPRQIDVLIIKKYENTPIQKNGRFHFKCREIQGAGNEISNVECITERSVEGHSFFIYVY